MKKLIVLLFTLSLLCCVAFGQVMVDPNRDPTAARTDASNVSATDSWRSTLAVYSKQETDNLTAGNSLLYYLAEVDGAFANYESLQNAPVTDLASDSAVTVGAAQVLSDQWITATGSPDLTVIRDGIYVLHQHVTKGTGSDMAVTYELGYVSAAGAWTFVASSAPELLTADSTEVSLDVNITVYEPVTILATDFLAIRQYAIRSGPTDTSLVNWYGSTKQAFFNVPIVGGSFARVDGSNITATTFRTNLSVSSTAEMSAAIATETAERDAHEASTTTAVHGLGTMSGETATNYAGASGANLSGTAFRSALGVYSAAELATYSAATSADLTGSNITAPAFRSSLDVYSKGELATVSAAINGSTTANFSAKDLAITNSTIHQTDINGKHVIIQGNSLTPSVTSSDIVLPVDGANTYHPGTGAFVNDVKALVTSVSIASKTACVFTLHSSFPEFEAGVEQEMGASSTIYTCNVATMAYLYDAKIVATGSGYAIVASSPADQEWKVIRMEIGGN